MGDTALESGPGIVGREDEVRRIETFVDSLSGGSRALVIRGEPGIGKTALWRHALDRCRASGIRVLQSRPAEEEMPLALGGLLDLFEPVGFDVEAIRAESNPIARGREVLDGLRRLAADSVSVVAVDDVQWLDPASARALRFALRRLDPEPVGVLATVLAGSDRDDPLAPGWPLPSTRTETVELGPLGLDELRHVLSGFVSSISRPTLRRIHEVSGGNPLYAIELARGLATHFDQSSSGSGLPLPDSLQAAIEERLAAAPPDLWPLLDTAAALGRASVKELRDALAEADLEGLLASAGHHEILVVEEDLSVRFSHPVIGSAVYQRMNPLARRSMHGRLADLAFDPDVRARHLALSTDDADQRVADELEAAAVRAGDRGAFDLSADYAHHSLRLTPPEDLEGVQRRAFLEIDGRAHGGEASEAVALADRLIETLPHGRRRAEALLRRSYLSDEDMDTEERMLLEALEEADDDALRGDVLDQLGWARGMFRGDLRGALRYSNEAAAVAERTGDAELQMLSGARAILHSLAGSRQPDRLARGVELEARNGKPSLWDSPRALLGEDLLWAGELASARELFEAVHADAVRSGEEGLRPYCLYDLALTACSSGDPAEAEALAREGIEASRDAEDSWGEMLLLYPLALALAWRGQADDAREVANRRLEGAARRGERPGIARARSVLGLLALSEGDSPAAARELAAAASLLDEMGMANPGAIPALPDAIEALAPVDETSAQALLARLQEQAARLDCAWPLAVADRCRGVLLLAQGESDEACEFLDRAVESFDRLGYRPDAARAVLARGRAMLRSGQRSLANAILSDARDRFAAIGAALWQARAVEALARATPGRAAVGLTVTERRVADLVMEGMKNRQIAEALLISVATVEAHLTRIYRKLDIRSRSDLARLVASGAIEVAHDSDS